MVDGKGKGWPHSLFVFVLFIVKRVMVVMETVINTG